MTRLQLSALTTKFEILSRQDDQRQVQCEKLQLDALALQGEIQKLKEDMVQKSFEAKMFQEQYTEQRFGEAARMEKHHLTVPMRP